MQQNKGFTVTTTLLIVLGIIVLGGVGYVAMNPQLLQAPVAEDEKTSIAWSFASAGEIEAIPYTA